MQHSNVGVEPTGSAGAPAASFAPGPTVPRVSGLTMLQNALGGS